MKTMLAALLLIAIAGRGVSAIVEPGPDATTVSLRGTLERYDVAARTLELTTRGGMVVVTLGPMTRIRLGRHEIDAAALEKLNGYRAVVRVSESAGSRIVQSIHVLEKSDLSRP